MENECSYHCASPRASGDLSLLSELSTWRNRLSFAVNVQKALFPSTAWLPAASCWSFAFDTLDPTKENIRSFAFVQHRFVGIWKRQMLEWKVFWCGVDVYTPYWKRVTTSHRKEKFYNRSNLVLHLHLCSRTQNSPFAIELKLTWLHTLQAAFPWPSHFYQPKLIS